MNSTPLNPDPDPAAATESRLVALEIQASFADEALEQMNQALYRQQQQIEALLREIGALREQLPQGTMPVLRSLRDDLPPHY